MEVLRPPFLPPSPPNSIHPPCSCTGVCGVVWCGVAWCVVVWRGVVGVVWCSVVWCGVAWCGVAWCGVVWCGVVWCGVVWCGVVWRGVVWCGVVWCGVAWCGVASNVSVPFSKFIKFSQTPPTLPPIFPPIPSISTQFHQAPPTSTKPRPPQNHFGCHPIGCSYQRFPFF